MSRPTDPQDQAFDQAPDQAHQAPTEPPANAPTNTYLPSSGTQELPLPCRFGRYEVRKILGKGGMGVVYLAHDPSLDRLVALKIPNLSSESGEHSIRFVREAKLAATLNHPGICPIYEIGNVGNLPYLTMALIEGKPLSAVAPHQPMAPRLAVRVVRDVALALEEAHEKGIVHRDLKPSNVMLDAKGRAIVMDFGLAHRDSIDESRLTRSGAVLGTPAYMSPEQVNGDIANMGPPTDVHALGVILYELLTGTLPFTGGPGDLIVQILQYLPEPLDYHVAGLDARLQTVIDKALAKRPGQRFANAGEFAKALEPILATLSQSGTLEIDAKPSKDTPTAERAVPKDSRRRQSRDLPPPDIAKKARKSSGVLKGWLIGCGTALFLVVAMCAGLGYFGYSLFKGLPEMVMRDMDRAKDFEVAMKAWNPPPPDAEPDVLFPKNVGEFARLKHDRFAAQPYFGIQEDGWHSTYHSPKGDVEVYLYRKNDLEVFGLMTKAFEKLRIKDNNQKKGGVDGFITLRGDIDSPPVIYDHRPPFGKERHGVFWWNSGLFVTVSSNSNPPEPARFLTDFLKAQSAMAIAAKLKN